MPLDSLNIFSSEVGFDAYMNRPGLADSATLPQLSTDQPESLLDATFSFDRAAAGTELASIVAQAKKSFSDTSVGWIQGIDTDGQFKWSIGSGSSGADWNVSAPDTFSVTGAIVAAAGTIGGFTIGATSLSATAGGNTTIVSSGITAFSSGPTGAPTFTVTQAGILACTGAIIDGTSTLGGRLGSTLASAINVSGNLITDLINARIDTAAKTILSDFDFGSTDYAGAVNAGTVTWNATTGAITGGSGVLVYRGGIVGVNTGVATFSIDAATGAATFAGALSAPTGNIGGFTLGATTMTATTGGNTTIVSSGATAFTAGPTGAPTFYVTQAGVLTCTGASISGSITASSGTIGGFTIGASSLSVTAGGNTTTVSSGVTAFSAGPTATPTFTVTQAGVMSCTGAIVDGTSTVGGRTGSALATAIDASSNLVTDLINARISTSAKTVLSDFSFGAVDYAGAVKAGTIAWNTTTGAITGGSGVVLYRGGIVGANAGVATFSIDAATGAATFAGALSAPTGTIGGFTIGVSSLSVVSGGNTTTVSSGVTAFSSGPTGSPTFSVTQAGVLSCTAAVIDGTSTLGGRLGSTLASAINSSGNLVTDLINVRLDTSSKAFLSDFNFGSTNYAGAVNSGTVTWNTTTGAITGGSGVLLYRSGILGVNAGVTTFSIDATTGAATFAGALSAPTGSIGGFTLGATTMTATNAGNTTIVSSGATAFTCGPTGAPTFTVTQAGVLSCTGATVSGGITTTAGSSLDGQYLGAASVASAAVNLAMRGWDQTCAFTATDLDTVSWGAGSFVASDGTTYAIGAGNTGNMAAKTYIYLDIAVSTVAYQTTTTAATAVGNGKVLVAIAQNGAVEPTFMVLNDQSLNIDASSIVASSITANEIAANTITGANILTLNISGKNATFDTGTIGGLTMAASTLTATAGGNTTTISSGVTAFSAGPTGSPTVTITQAGVLTCTGAVVNGTPLSNQDTFGDGSDGSATIAVNTVLTKDTYYTNLTVNAGVRLETRGFLLFGTGTLTNNGTIVDYDPSLKDGGDGADGLNGSATNAAGGTAGGASVTATVYGSLAGKAGGQGGLGGYLGSGNGTAGTAGTVQTESLVSTASSAGGNGGGTQPQFGNGGTGGAGATSTAAVRNNPRMIAFLSLMQEAGSSSFLKGGCSPGSGGGGGGGYGNVTGATGRGGGGGGGGGSGAPGGIVSIFFRIIDNTATGIISADGGDGGDGGDGTGGPDLANGGAGGGGGSGGHGGIVSLVYSSLTNGGIISAAAGAAGVKGIGGAPNSFGGSTGPNGVDGSAGSAGKLIQLTV